MIIEAAKFSQEKYHGFGKQQRMLVCLHPHPYHRQNNCDHHKNHHHHLLFPFFILIASSIHCLRLTWASSILLTMISRSIAPAQNTFSPSSSPPWLSWSLLSRRIVIIITTMTISTIKFYTIITITPCCGKQNLQKKKNAKPLSQG